MKTLLIFTVRYPFGNGESFFADELQQLAQSFARIELVPICGAPTQRALPGNVFLHRPLWTTAGERWRFLARSLLSPRVAALALAECRHCLKTKVRLSAAVLIRIVLWSIYRTALEAHPAVNAAIRDPKDKAAYAYWGHTPSLGILKLSRHGIPCAVRYHRVDLYREGMQHNRWYHRDARYFPWREEIASASRLLIFVSRHGHAYFRQSWPRADLADMLVSPLGVANPEFSSLARNRLCDQSTSAFVMVSCSGIRPQKRVERIAAFASEMARHRPNLVWHHFGGGVSSGILDALRLSGRTLTFFLHGELPNRSIHEFYKTNPVSLFVNLSDSEGIPVAIMEALSYDIPVLATNVGGTSEAVVTGESGMLVDMDEALHPYRLAEKVNAALQEGGALFGARPREFWLRHFNATDNFRVLAERLAALPDHARLSL